MLQHRQDLRHPLLCDLTIEPDRDEFREFEIPGAEQQTASDHEDELVGHAGDALSQVLKAGEPRERHRLVGVFALQMDKSIDRGPDYTVTPQGRRGPDGLKQCITIGHLGVHVRAVRRDHRSSERRVNGST